MAEDVTCPAKSLNTLPASLDQLQILDVNKCLLNQFSKHLTADEKCNCKNLKEGINPKSVT